MQKKNHKESSFLSIPGGSSNRPEHSSPVGLFVIMIASIFFAEVIAMIVVRIIEPLPYVLTTLIDAGIMIILIFPILYLFSFSPLLQQIKKLQQTEKILQQKDALNERFFDSIDTLIAYMDCDFNVIRVNDAFAREESLSPEYFVGKNHFDLYPHADNREIFQNVVNSGKAYSAYEQPFQFPSQPERGVTYWNWSLQPVLGSDGKADGVVLSKVDVTARKQAEKQVSEMALFPALNPDAVLQVDGNGQIRKSNPVAEQMGLGPRMELFKLIPAFRNVDLPGFIEAGSTKSVYEAPLGERILQWTMRGVPDLGLAFLYSKDVTERKRSEETVRMLSSIVEQTADTVLVTNCDGVIEYVNRAFERLTGYQKAEALGQTPRVIKSGLHDKQFYEKMWDTILKGRTYQDEITNRKKNGDIFHEVKTITPLRNQQGEITHFVATGKDITERKLAEEQLRKAYEDLEIRVQDRTEEFRIAISELEDEINVRWRAEAALQKSEQQLKRAQEMSHLGSWELDLPTNQFAWSDEVYRIFGLEPQEFGATYEAFLEAVHPEDRAAVNEEYSSSIRDGRDTYEIEHRVVKHSTGEIRIVHEKCEHFRNETGEIVRSIGMVHDITERKHVEVALQRSEAFLNRTGEMARVGGWELDVPSMTLLWSRETYRIHEVDLSFHPSVENALNFYAPEYRNLISNAVDRAINEGQAYDLELPFITARGRDLWIRTMGQPEIRDGICVRLFGAFQDITDRKRAEEALRRAHDELELRVHERTAELAIVNQELSSEIAERREIERQLRIQAAAMEAAANGIIITDPQGIILWTNPAITQISGYAYQELVGKSTSLFNSGRQEAEFYHEMWKTILAGNVWHGETTNRRKDGRLYVEEQTITPVQNEDGEISHFIAIKQDVTERNLIYSQLEDSNRDLRKLTASERQQRFLAEGLVESSVALNMSLELHAVLDRIFEQTRRTIPYLLADVVLIKDGVANVVQQWGENRPGLGTIPENENLRLQDFPIWEQISETKSAVMIPDTSLDHRWNTSFGTAWIRSYIGAPLIYGEQVIGIINLGTDQANAFHQDMVKTLAAFAAPAAVAIQNARLYEDEQQNRKIAETLSAASVALAQTLDIQMVMETILDYVQFVMPLDVAFVILSEGEERYRIRAVRTADHNTELKNSIIDQAMDMLSQPLLRSYLTKHESTSIPDSREIPNWDPPAELASFHCWLGVPLESLGKVLGLVVVAHTVPRSFGSNQIQVVEAVIKQAVVALQNAWLFEQVRSGRERLQQLSRHLVEIQENERKYIARELHDETSQSLTSLKLGLQVMEQKAVGHEQLTEQILNLKKLADETLESLHHLAVNLRPASLDHLGLVDSLTGLIESTRQRSGLSAHFKTMGTTQAEPLNNEMETSIYRIVQESITNVIRHAHATYVDVILEWQDDKIVIIIEDDGVGIDTEKASEKGHLGLIGMQERAEMLGGKLLVDSAPQVGTTLVVEIPYAN